MFGLRDARPISMMSRSLRRDQADFDSFCSTMVLGPVSPVDEAGDVRGRKADLRQDPVDAVENPDAQVSGVSAPSMC